VLHVTSVKGEHQAAAIGLQRAARMLELPSAPSRAGVPQLRHEHDGGDDFFFVRQWFSFGEWREDRWRRGTQRVELLNIGWFWDVRYLNWRA
jgi:hypothetical protein